MVDNEEDVRLRYQQLKTILHYKHAHLWIYPHMYPATVFNGTRSGDVYGDTINVAKVCVVRNHS